MTDWLFYQTTKESGGTKLEFCSFCQGKINNDWLPQELSGTIDVPTGVAIEGFVNLLVRKYSRWASNQVQSADSEIGRAVLKGRW